MPDLFEALSLILARNVAHERATGRHPATLADTDAGPRRGEQMSVQSSAPRRPPRLGAARRSGALG